MTVSNKFAPFFNSKRSKVHKSMKARITVTVPNSGVISCSTRFSNAVSNVYIAGGPKVYM